MFSEFAVHTIPVGIDTGHCLLGNKLVEANVLHVSGSLRIERVDDVILKYFR